MLSKMNLMLNIAFLPFKDLLFYDQEKINRITFDSHNLNKKQKKFQKEIHHSILSSCVPSSLDEVDLLMNKFHPYLYNVYFKNSEKNVESLEREIYQYFFQIIEQFSKGLLSHRDGEIVFKYWKQERSFDQVLNSEIKYDDVWDAYSDLDKVHMFNMLGRLIPLDLLVATHYEINGLYDPMQLNSVYHHINLADAPLHDILRHGVAENHIHASAAFNFSLLWTEVMNFKGNMKQEFLGGYFKKFQNKEYSNSNETAEYILTAQIIRIILAQYLKSKSNEPIYQWINNLFKFDVKEFNSILTILSSKNHKNFQSIIQLKECLEYLKKEFSLDDGDRKNDILFSIFQEEKHIKTYAENIFLHHVMKYKNQNWKKEKQKQFTEFFSLFFQYIRIKNEFYQQINQVNSIKGLDFFRPYFDRATSGFDKKDKSYYVEMLRNLFQNQYLKKVELRLSIANKKDKNRDNLKKIFSAYKHVLVEDYNIEKDTGVDFPRLGIVYHLIKEKDDTEKNWENYDMYDDKTWNSLHYGKSQHKYFNLVDIMLYLRNKVPYLANFVVGLDAASLENNTPTHVFASVFEKARNSDNDQMLMRDGNAQLSKQQSLFFTFHAGEDFRHLNSGLRRIDEVIQFCKFHSGDRIGHGIALGLSVEKWVSRNSVVVVPRGEYLDNLLWIWGVYTRTTDINYKTFIYLEHRINVIAKSIFEITNGLTIELLYEVYQERFKPLYKCFSKLDIEECQKNKNSQSKAWDVRTLLNAYHEQKYLEKMEDSIYINSSANEEEMTKDMQRYLRDKVAMNGIVIEVNPSSNYVIGQMDSLYENQFFQINTLDDNNLSNIMININSDDPIVFNTNVSNEMAYLYYGMLYKGIGKDSALKWIEKVRKSGMDTSFIRDNVSNYDYIRQLDSLIEALDNPTYC